jgi:hypothetical protein
MENGTVSSNPKSPCRDSATTAAECSCESGLTPLFEDTSADVACCGPPAGPPTSPYERTGFRLCHFVKDFIDTPAGSVPRIKTLLEKRDRFGNFMARLGPGRNDYKIVPGLYAVGRPDKEAPVLVTANYKLTFDALRRELTRISAWILVLDTRGINVWCAAGKKTFSAQEVVSQVRQSGLDKIVAHRKLILPQLSANGVSAKQVKKECGFKVVWGPVRARDIKSFLEKQLKADTTMRRVTFTLSERLVLIPVELSAMPKPLFWVTLAAFLISGVGPEWFSLGTAWSRGLILVAAVLVAIVSGAVAAPIMLPWIPVRAFSLKGAIIGAFTALLLILYLFPRIDGLEAATLILAIMAVSSYLAMNFTGSTPYTSPSGVEKEMRKAIPLQAVAVLFALSFWIAAGLING